LPSSLHLVPFSGADTPPEQLQLLPAKPQFFPLMALLHQFLSTFPVVWLQMCRYPGCPDVHPVKNVPGIIRMM
jgi:hypothetical protein